MLVEVPLLLVVLSVTGSAQENLPASARQSDDGNSVTLEMAGRRRLALDPSILVEADQNIEEDISEQHDLSANYPERLQQMVSEVEKMSRSHTQPLWFDSKIAEAQWKKAGMPKYDRLFHLGQGETLVEPAPAKETTTKGDSTKAEFIAAQKAMSEQKGWRFDQAKIEKQFDEIDTNKDGIASGKEKTAYWAKVKERIQQEK